MQIIFLSFRITSHFYHPRTNLKIIIFSLSSFTHFKFSITILFFARSKHTKYNSSSFFMSYFVSFPEFRLKKKQVKYNMRKTTNYTSRPNSINYGRSSRSITSSLPQFSLDQLPVAYHSLFSLDQLPVGPRTGIKLSHLGAQIEINRSHYEGLE
jgi:hypothetical protein